MPQSPGVSTHPFAELIGLSFSEMVAGNSECQLTVEPRLMNPNGVVHGAVLYALADTGMGGALFPMLDDGELCATIEIKISYFRPVRQGTLRCKSRVIRRGRRVAHLDAEIDSEGELLARATGSFSIFAPRAESGSVSSC